MSEGKVMYVGEFSYVKDNREGFGYNFVEFNVDSKGARYGRAKTIFTGSKVETGGLVPGDLVNCKFGAPSSLGGKAPLIGISVVEESKVFKR